MRLYLAAYAVGLVTLLVLDYFWLGLIARSYYRKALGRVIAFEMHAKAACCFYLLQTLGVLVFVLHPLAFDGGTLQQVMVRGAWFGLFTYGTYDLTSMATIRNWPLPLTIIDMVWGVLVTAASATAAAAVLLLC